MFMFGMFAWLNTRNQVLLQKSLIETLGFLFDLIRSRLKESKPSTACTDDIPWMITWGRENCWPTNSVLRFLPVWSCSQPSGVKTWAIADALVQIQSPSFPKAKGFSRKGVPLQRSAEALPVRGIRSRPSPREQPTTGQSRCATHELQGSEKYGQTVCLGMSLTCWLEVQILYMKILKAVSLN